MMAFQTVCFENYYAWFSEILQEGVNSGELKTESLALAQGLFVVGKGMFISKNTTNTMYDLKQELNNFIDTLFTLLEVQK
jgi:hypothetical protein